MKLRIKVLLGLFAVIGSMTASVFSVNAVRTPLHDAVRDSNCELIKILCRQHPEWLSEQDPGDGRLPIECTERLDILKVLVENGANVNERRKNDGATALHKVRSYEILEYLVRNNGNVCAVDKVNNTPLHEWIMEFAQEDKICLREAIDLLVRHGANINARNRDGQTPLGRLKHLRESIEQMLKKPLFADVNFSDEVRELPGKADKLMEYMQERYGAQF